MQEKDESLAFLFGNEGQNRPKWDAQKRFISDDFRLVYTQGVTARGYLPETEFARFLESLRSDLKSATEIFRGWTVAERPQGGHFADVAMDRLDARSSDLDIEAAEGVLKLFAEVMDDFYLRNPKSQMFFDVWDQSESILNGIRKAAPAYHMSGVIQQSARHGNAISWMIQMIGRRELWARGLAGDRRLHDERYLLKEESLRKFIRQLFARIKLMKNQEILRLPRLLGVLYALKESPWEVRTLPRFLDRLYGPQVRDLDFLKFLIAVGGTVVSSDRGAYATLSAETLSGLLDGEYVQERLGTIRKRRTGKELASLRKEVDAMIERASSY